ncbi:MAG: hypothetical protein QM762_14290 [Chryseolinea sp.]
MKRIHALEWEDLRWFPESWRDYGTDYLRFIAIHFGIYKPVLPLLRKGLLSSGGNEWVDCASGGGSSLVDLAMDLQIDIPTLRIILTDYYPNIKSFEYTKAQLPRVFRYESASVNAMDMPAHLRGKFITLFGAFHHFREAEAKRILQNAVDTQSPIGIFEPLNRTLASALSMLFVPINVWLFTPFMRPTRWNVLPFIYLIPIIPLFILWDGVASIFRMYSAKELKGLVSTLKNGDSFQWEIGKTKTRMPVYYLLGVKK